MTRKVKAMGQREKGEAFLALADRCEREEPSRELDYAITLATWADGTVENHNARARYDVWVAAGCPTASERSVMGSPDYTTSLDAAVTLVQQPGSWDVDSAGCASATALVGRFLVSDDIERHATGRTPALALCAAALRARAALENT